MPSGQDWRNRHEPKCVIVMGARYEPAADDRSARIWGVEPEGGSQMRNWWQDHLAARPTQFAWGAVMLGCLALILFALGSAALLDRAPVREADAQTATWFYEHVGPTVHDVFLVVTAFGSPVLWVLGFGVGVYLIIRRQWALLAGWALAMAAGKVWNEALKAWLARPRPAFPGWDNPASGYGFPSGHTMQSTLAYGMLVYLGWRRVRQSCWK